MRDSHDAYTEASDDIPLKETGDGEVFENQEHDYLPTARLIPILIGLCLQSFCIALVSLPIPTMT